MANSKSNTLANRYTFLYVFMYVLYTTFKFNPWRNSAKKNYKPVSYSNNSQNSTNS